MLFSINRYFLLFTIDTLDFENYRSRSVVATGYHNFIVVHPAVHNASALKRRVDVAADGIPRFGTERNALRSAVRRSGRL